MKKLASFIVSLALILIIGGSAWTDNKGNTKFQSFNKAKKILLKQIYQDHRTTFYCQVPFTKDKEILSSSKYTRKRSGSELTGWNGSTSSLLMHSVNHLKSGVRVTLTEMNVVEFVELVHGDFGDVVDPG